MNFIASLGQYHFSLGPFIIACLGRYFRYFISPQDHLSLLAWGNILDISFLPRTIYHCLPRAIFQIFHFSLGLFIIACLGRYLRYSVCPCFLIAIFQPYHYFPRALITKSNIFEVQLSTSSYSRTNQSNWLTMVFKILRVNDDRRSYIKINVQGAEKQ